MKIYDNIKALYLALVEVLMASMSFDAPAQEQEQEKAPDVYEQAETEADRLQRILDLEDWQVFYVDSTLKHDFPAMMAEYEEMKNAKIGNTIMYVAVQDKWMDQIDATYRKIFTDEQWAAYLRQGAGKAQKAREKRRMKAEGKK
jgi:hypothetical protein